MSRYKPMRSLPEKNANSWDPRPLPKSRGHVNGGRIRRLTPAEMLAYQEELTRRTAKGPAAE